MSDKLPPVRHIRPGESVTAGVTSRPDIALAQRTNALKQQLDASAAGQALLDIDAPLDPNVLAGQPVYWDPINQRWAAAIVSVSTEAETGALVHDVTSEVAGLVLTKKSAAVGNVLLAGIAKVPDLANAVDGEIVAGRYFLSSAERGKLVRQSPPVSVYVCLVLGAVSACDDTPSVIFFPQYRDFLESHIHYSFDLACQPAGDLELSDDELHQRVVDADVTLRGWLPANHESFNGTAPQGAVFGYNLAAHPQLSRVWPPIPLSAVSVLWDKGLDRVGATEVLVDSEGLVQIDINGIWWNSNCVDDTPWPSDWTPSMISSSLSIGDVSLDSEDCPREERMRLKLVFSRQVYENAHSVVTALRPAEASPIVITNCDGDPAVTGDLFVGINLGLSLDPDEALGGLVVKGITNALGQQKGYVLEGLISNSENLVLTSTHQRYLTPDDEETAVVHQGIVTATVLLDPAERELNPEFVRLDDAQMRLYQDVPYIGFPANKNSSIAIRINVPPAGLPNSPAVVIRAEIFGLSTGTLPEMGLSYRRMARPDPSTAIAGSFTEIDFPTQVSVLADTIVEISSESFSIEPGDTILLLLTRESVAGYTDEVGLFRLGAVITGG